MFARLVTSALFAGAASGLIAGGLHLLFLQPLLLQAELYESGQLIHFGATAGSVVAAVPAPAGIDLLRDGLTLVFSLFLFVGYALLLVALMALADERGIAASARRGLLWGIAGAVAVVLAPAFSLPPELPGNAAGEIGARQIWWFATVGCAAAAMGLIAFGTAWAHWGTAIALLVVPHLIGAPQPAAFTGPVPPELGAHFAARALGVGCAAWSALGLCSGYFWRAESATA